MMHQVNLCRKILKQDSVALMAKVNLKGPLPLIVILTFRAKVI